MTALANELAADPLGRGYAGMTDEEAAADLNTAYRTRALGTITAAEIWNAVDATEYAALDAAGKAQVDLISGMGDAVPIQAGLIKSTLFGIFNAQSTSRANLIALVAPPQTRAEELDLGIVKVGQVEEVRRG